MPHHFIFLALQTAQCLRFWNVSIASLKDLFLNIWLSGRKSRSHWENKNSWKMEHLCVCKVKQFWGSEVFWRGHWNELAQHVVLAVFRHINWQHTAACCNPGFTVSSDHMSDGRGVSRVGQNSLDKNTNCCPRIRLNSGWTFPKVWVSLNCRVFFLALWAAS